MNGAVMTKEDKIAMYGSKRIQYISHFPLKHEEQHVLANSDHYNETKAASGERHTKHTDMSEACK